MNLNNYSKIGIIGFGREGVSVLHYLESIDYQGEVFIMDRNIDLDYPDTFLNVSMLLGKTYLKNLNEVDLIFKSPGVPMHIPEIDDALNKGVKFTSATNLFFELNPSKKIVVTGSKGKSSTSTMLYQMLNANNLNVKLVGNIGVSMLDFLYDEIDYFVIELSSQQLELLDSEFDYGVFTSFFPDHMDYHGSFEAYKDTKFKFFKLCKSPVVNIDNQIVLDFLKKNKVEAQVYGDLMNYVDGNILYYGDIVLDLTNSDLKGEDMKKNFLGALLMTQILNLNLEVCKEVAFDFEYLPHRQEVIVLGSKTYINDSASVTPDSTISALKTFTDVDVLILGGLDRGYDFTELFEFVFESKVKLVCILPDLKFDKFQLKADSFKCFNNLSECMDFLKNSSFQKILFSPGAPSYNVYHNFYERGDDFKSLIN